MMGASEPESRQMFPVKESEHGSSETSNGSRMYPATTLGEDIDFTNSRMLSSSRSSSSGDPFELDADEISKSYAGNIGVRKHSKNAQVSLEDHGDDIPVSSMPWQEQPPIHAHIMSYNDGSATQFPPTQAMERTVDSNPSAAHRIPSSVFARTKSNSPMEWSVASNESLFSIYTGNTSFTRDHQNWLGKSGELGFPGDSTPLIDYSSNQPPNQHPVNKSTEVGPTNSDVNENLGVTDQPKPSETIRGVVKEDGEDGNKDKSLAKGSLHSASLSRRSDASGHSIQSFAFPILTGDDKSYSLSHPSSRHQSLPQTPRPAQSPQAQLEPKLLSSPETLPKANLNVAQGLRNVLAEAEW